MLTSGTAAVVAGSAVGQVAVFDSFQLEDGTEGKCTGIDPVATAMEAARAKLPPSQEDIDVSTVINKSLCVAASRKVKWTASRR